MNRSQTAPPDRWVPAVEGQSEPRTSLPGVLGVVVPCYNEAGTIEELLRRVLAQPVVAAVVVVDDGSSDESWARLQPWPGRDARVRLVRHERNQGKGAAIRSALATLSTPWLIIQDADLEYDPRDYSRLLAPLVEGKADVAYGSRFTAQPLPSSPWWHRWGNRVLTWLTNRVTGLCLTDEATGYKLVPRTLLQRLELRENGFGFCPELTAKLAHSGVRIVEVPVQYHSRRRSEGKKIRLWHGLQAVYCILKYGGWRRARPAVPKQT